jgi:hypothetical protein
MTPKAYRAAHDASKAAMETRANSPFPGPAPRPVDVGEWLTPNVTSGEDRLYGWSSRPCG